jgi:hypothetical protein
VVEEAIESVSVVTDREIRDLPGEEVAEEGVTPPDHIALTEDVEEDPQEAGEEATLLEEGIPMEAEAQDPDTVVEEARIREEDLAETPKTAETSERILSIAETEEAWTQEDLETPEDQRIREDQRTPEDLRTQEDPEALEDPETRGEATAKAPLAETTLQDTHQTALLTATRKSDLTKLTTTPQPRLRVLKRTKFSETYSDINMIYSAKSQCQFVH